MVCAKRIECSETSEVSEIRRILDSMIWFERDCDEETRRLSSQVTRYAFTSDDRRSATGMLNLCSTGLGMISLRNFAFGASTPWVDDRRFERRRRIARGTGEYLKRPSQQPLANIRQPA